MDPIPLQASVENLAPEKSVHTIKLAMGSIRQRLDEKAEEPKSPRFAPAGQSTQMIVGADASDDQTILSTAETLYSSYKLKRVRCASPSAMSSLLRQPVQGRYCCACNRCRT